MPGNETKSTLPGGPKTVGARLDRLGGSASGFDYLRIGLAFSVVVWHSFETSYANGTSVNIWNHLRGLISFILPSFFSLSGFLVAGSLARTKSVSTFLIFRAVRIVPALLVEILLSAFIVGTLFTVLPRAQYFSSPDLWSYLWNVVGEIHYRLPGVFLDSPTSNIVNKSLWTIPYEFECYAILVGLSLLTAARRGWLLLLTSLISVGMCAYVDLRHSAILTSIGPPGRLMVISFLAGVSMFLERDRLPFSFGWFIAAAAVSVVFLCIPQTMFLAAIPVAYVTVWLGMQTPKHVPVLMDGDYSYGLYLFAYPLQQTYAHLFAGSRHWYFNVAFATGLGLCYAFLSWNLIEKPILKHRKKITLAIERTFGLPLRYVRSKRDWPSLASPK